MRDGEVEGEKRSYEMGKWKVERSGWKSRGKVQREECAETTTSESRGVGFIIAGDNVTIVYRRDK